MATSALAAALALVEDTTAAVASAPPVTTSEMAIRAGQEALKKALTIPAPTTPAATAGTHVTAVSRARECLRRASPIGPAPSPPHEDLLAGDRIHPVFLAVPVATVIRDFIRGRNGGG